MIGVRDTRRVIASLMVSALAFGGASAQDRAGAVDKIQHAGFQTMQKNGPGDPLDIGSDILMNAKVYTKQYGTVEIELLDDTRLTVAPSSVIRITKFVYSGDNPRMVMRFARGAMRFVSGRLPSRSYRVGTQVAAIGVRGTDFWLRRPKTKLIEVWVDDGVVVARPNESGQNFRLEAPVYAQCDLNECRTGPAPPRPVTYPADPTAGDTEGPGDSGPDGDGGDR